MLFTSLYKPLQYLVASSVADLVKLFEFHRRMRLSSVLASFIF